MEDDLGVSPILKKPRYGNGSQEFQAECAVGRKRHSMILGFRWNMGSWLKTKRVEATDGHQLPGFRDKCWKPQSGARKPSLAKFVTISRDSLLADRYLKLGGWVKTHLFPGIYQKKIHPIYPTISQVCGKYFQFLDIELSKNRGTPKSSIFMGLSLIN